MDRREFLGLLGIGVASPLLPVAWWPATIYTPTRPNWAEAAATWRAGVQSGEFIDTPYLVVCRPTRRAEPVRRFLRNPTRPFTLDDLDRLSPAVEV